MSHETLEWTLHTVPPEEYWGADIDVQLSNGALRIRCITQSLCHQRDQNDGIAALLLAGVHQELEMLMHMIPTDCKTTLEIHGANSPYMLPPERGTPFRYWLRVHDGNTHVALFTHDHHHQDFGTIQCIQGLRIACQAWIQKLEHRPAKTPAA